LPPEFDYSWPLFVDGMPTKTDPEM